MQLLSKPLTRRYTPPTCTLEVTGETSALSQWTSRPVLKNVQFQLSLDDPRQPREQPLQIRGDREQLQALSETVETYVQDLINASPTALSLGLPLEEAPNLPPEKETGHVPQSLLRHSLPLTALGDEATPTTVTLSATQLFDLATALEEYSAEATALPVPSSSKPLAWLAETPIWARSAAIALMAVGVSLAILELANQDSPSQLARQEAASPQNDRLPVPSPPPTDALPQIPPLSTAPVAPFPSPPVIPSPPAQPNIVPAPNPGAPSAPSGAAQEAFPESLAIQPRPQASAAPAPQPPDVPPPAADAPFSIAAQNGSEVTSRSAARPQTEQLADTVPQVAEARSYFQERWQPPESLKQTLEYTLILNPDGSLQRAVPLGEAAATYLDRTPIPLANEPFVAPLGGRGSALIRLVLHPDGEVQTFLQPSN